MNKMNKKIQIVFLLDFFYNLMAVFSDLQHDIWFNNLSAMNLQKKIVYGVKIMFYRLINIK